MRLTLRTLLSWKDGMLDPEAARDLAARIEASDKAAQIVAKITEAVGRTTLSAAAPDAGDFATAATTTAEYLDNVLPAEQLERFERLCLASDAQLAETAACHEILAAWSREAAEPLDRKARRRLLAAVRARVNAAESAPAPPRAAARVHRPAPVETRSSRPPLVAWLLVAAAALLLIVLVGVLGWSLAPRGRKAAAPADVAVRGGEPVVPEGASEPAAAVPTPPPAAGPGDVANTNMPPAAAVAPPAAPDESRAETETPPPMPAAPAAPDAATAAAAPDVAVDRPPAPPATADQVGGADTGVEPPPSLAAGPRVTSGDAIAIAAPPAPAAAAPQAAAAAPAEPRPPSAPARIAGPAVLLHRPPGIADIEAWVAGAEGSPLDLPVDLVAPPFGRPALAVDDVRVVLEPGTRAMLSRDADGTPRLTLVFGAASAVGGSRLAVTAGDLAGTIADGLDAPVGVEVDLRRDPGAAAEAATRTARVLPSAGAIAWRGAAPADGGARAVRVGTALVWRSTAPATSALEPAAVLPEWLAGRPPAVPADALAARALGSRLAAGTAAAAALRELAADRRVEGRVAAAATLALVGEFAEVARLIAAEGAAALPESLWSRLDTAAVQPALARGPLAAGGLAQALSDQSPPGAADTIVRFARGFTDDELAAGAATELVEALESPHLAVRRYAIKNLVEITRVDAADRLRYRADRPAAALREGAAWWRAQLEQGRIARGAAAGVRR